MANVSKISDGITTYDISSITVKNQNSLGNSLKMWTGTKAQYDAIINWYAWSSSTDTIYTLSDTPSLGDSVYDNTFTAINTVRNTGSGGTTISIKDGDLIIIYTRDSNEDVINKDANTLYNITDDMQASTYEAYSKDETDTLISTALNNTLSTLYPIGSIYIGTQSTCPLQTLGIGTWQLVAQDRVLQGAGTRGSVGSTINESLPNHQHNSVLMRLNQSGYGETIPSGTAYYNQSGGSGAIQYSTSVQTNKNKWNIGFTQNTNNPIYQDNAPVQQDAYLVNIWQRIS